jgi:hydrogenase maturation protease
MSTKILLIGLGNILLQDEGVGVHVVNAIRGRYACTPEVDIIDGGTLGLDLLPLFSDREKVLIIDAVNFGKEHGYIGVLEDGEIPAVLHAKLSVHHIGLADILSAATLMGVKPRKIRLIGIQPESTNTFGLEVTPAVREKIEELIEKGIATLKEWNVTCALLSPQESSV